MKSSTWWTLRRWWHTPSSKQQCFWPLTFIQRYKDGNNTEYYLNPFYRLKWNRGDYRGIIRIFFIDLKALIYIVYWKFMWLQPLRCNGNYGGWRTQFCEWLENKAREHEDIEDEFNTC